MAASYAMAQGNTFVIDGKEFLIEKTTLNKIGDGGLGTIWSFTAYDSKGKNQAQLYITNNDADGLYGSQMRPYNEWRHVYVAKGKEKAYTYPDASVTEKDGQIEIKVSSSEVKLYFCGKLLPPRDKNAYKNKDRKKK